MSLKDTEKLVNLEGLTTYTQMLNVKQEAQNNKIAQIVGELAEATAQLTKTTAKVDCDHRYEITGATNDEHNLAIDDQQMLINKISGRTLVRNQIYKPVFQGDNWGGTNISFDSDNVITLSGTPTISYATTNNFNDLMNLPHTYMIEFNVLANPNSVPLVYGFLNRLGSKTGIVSGVGVSRTIFKQTEAQLQEGKGEGLDGFAAGTDLTGIKYRVRIIDLTLAYGLGNEPTTVEEVLNDLPEYIPYDEGTFVHSNNKLISTGKNLFNQDKVFPELGFERIGDGSYKMGTPYTSLLNVVVWKNSSNYTGQMKLSFDYYSQNNSSDYVGLILRIDYTDGTRDSATVNDRKVNQWTSCNRTSVSSKTIKKISFTYATAGADYTIFKNVMLTTDLNATDYEPYKEEVIEVGELKQWDYKDNQSGNDVFGSGEVDLGTLDYFYLDNRQVFYTSIVGKKYGINNFKCEKYSVSAKGFDDLNNYDVMGNQAGTTLYFKNTTFGSDVIAFKNSLQGSKLLYELETPTIVENDNIPAGMSVYKGGMQIQEGTIPYNIEKQYALSIASQVAQNIEIDREQQKQIDNMKVDIDHKQSLLLSGQNIKTFNGKSMLGSGDLAWNDPMFLAKFNDVTDYVNQNSGIIDELLEGKTYRIYSDNDSSSSVYSFNIRLKLKIDSGETKTYVITLPTKTKNFVDFRLDNIILNGQRATLYYNVDNVDYTQLLTQQGDTVTGDYETYGWGALYLSGTYAAVFEPVELLTKEDLVEVKPIQSIKETLTVGERGEISISQMPILTRPIYMFNKTKGNHYYLFIDLVSYTIVCRKNGVLKNPDEVFYSLTIDSENDIKDIYFIQGEYSEGDIIEVIYEYGYIDPNLIIEI